ncbi:MAG: nucleotidyltransferase family protein [Acidobacteriota bacterium]
MGAEPSINRFPEALLLRDLMRVWDGDKIAPGGGPGRTAHALPPVFSPSGCDWKEFLRLVRHHGVAHPVRQAIDRLEEGLIPPGVVRSLEQNIFEVRSYNILLLDRLGKVARHFERERIPFLVLKGLALQPLLYIDAAARPSSDLDLLVRHADLKRTLDTLASVGFNVPRGGERHFWVEWYHHIQLSMGEGMPVSIEIHWDLELRERYPFPIEEMWQRSVGFSAAGCQLRALCPEDQYVHGAVHLARHFHTPRLVWLMDLRCMARCWKLDWPSVADRARRCRGRTALWFAAAYEERVFGNSLQPAEHRTELRSLQRLLLKQVRGERPLEPLRDVAAERRRIFATLLLFDRLADLVRFLSVHGWRKLLRWTGIEFLLRRRSREI